MSRSSTDAAPAMLAAERRIRLQVDRSWQRCSMDLALKPQMQRSAFYVGREELQRRRRRMGATFSMATAEMQKLYRLMPCPVGITLTDADGVILSYVGGAGFTEPAQRAGMREGAVWTEAAQGTNGMGTCLAAREPVLIRRGEHYLRQNSAFTCVAAPIGDRRGAVTGVLNVSCVDELSWAPMLALVVRAAQAIESRTLLEQSREAHVLRFHRLRAFVTTEGEGLLALDSSGRVIGTNRSALELLGVATPEMVLDQAIETLVDIGLDELRALARQQPWNPQRLAGSGLHGLLQSPSPAPDREQQASCADALTVDDPLARAEREALLQVLEACDWNVSLAARQLKLGRKTLYRKIGRCRLVRPGAGADEPGQAIPRHPGITT